MSTHPREAAPGRGRPSSGSPGRALRITIGQYTATGRKTANQDFHGAVVPQGGLLDTKGVALALADGISSSQVSQIASETAVAGFLADYYSTPDSWSVKTSVNRVIQAINAWLYTQTRNGPHRYNLDRGYVCTFTALVFKSTTGHLVHCGDARAYRVAGRSLEQLTEDHRRWVSGERSYLSRALGMGDFVELDYRTLDLEHGDTFLLATDGVYEYMDPRVVTGILHRDAGDLDRAARSIVDHALENGSEDNLTVQLARVEELPERELEELRGPAASLPFPPALRPRMEFDGYRIERELHHSSRSHVYLAVDLEAGCRVVLKTPSVDKRDDAAYLERFLMEDWVARRIDNVHVLRPWAPERRRNFLYIATEFVDGQTLAQWMTDHPEPDLEQVRDIVEQIARGLLALHRREMLHQDLRPQNILIDRQGTVKLIDFGSVRVAGVAEIGHLAAQPHILGTAQYTAPEYFLGEPGTTRSDLYSLGVIAYQMLGGGLPYGAAVARATSRTAQRRLRYRPLADGRRAIPAWVDGALRKAVHPVPDKRYAELSEFTHDLRVPNPEFLRDGRKPLIERNPTLFWQGLSLILAPLLLTPLPTHPALDTASDAAPPQTAPATGAVVRPALAGSRAVAEHPAPRQGGLDPFGAVSARHTLRRRRDRLGSAAADAAILSAHSRNDGVAVSAEVLRYFLS